MEEFILELILARAEKFVERRSAIAKVLFRSCYDLPEKAREVRPSYLNFQNVIKWGGTVENAIAASLLTLNTVHGPFFECYELIEKYSELPLDEFKNYVNLELESGNKIPGFGNPIIKIRDVRCIDIATELGKTTSRYCLLSEFIERELHNRKDTNIYSNLAFWSAAGAHVIGLPKSHASLIPILSFVCRYVNSV